MGQVQLPSLAKHPTCNLASQYSRRIHAESSRREAAPTSTPGGKSSFGKGKGGSLRRSALVRPRSMRLISRAPPTISITMTYEGTGIVLR